MAEEITRRPLRLLAVASTFALIPLLGACGDDDGDDDDDDDGMGARPAAVLVVPGGAS